jgi:hypothetical protein
VPVDVVVGDVAVALLADAVGQPADGQQVVRAIKGDAVVEAQALVSQHLFGDGLQFRVVDEQFGQFKPFERGKGYGRDTSRAAPQERKNNTLI